MWELIRESNRRQDFRAISALYSFNRVLGLDLDSVRVEEELSPEHAALIEERQKAREAKDWARADAVRDELLALGVALEDGPKGTTWKVKA